MKLIDKFKCLLPDNFYLTWPAYRDMGCSRSLWESMRDSVSERLTIDEFIDIKNKTSVESTVYFNLVALLREKFRVSVFDTDDHFELSIRAVHQALYAINACEATPTHSEIVNSIIEIENIIAKYKLTSYDVLILERLNFISMMSKTERVMLATLPSLTQPVKFSFSPSGAFTIESIE